MVQQVGFELLVVFDYIRILEEGQNAAVNLDGVNMLQMGPALDSLF